MNQHEHLGRLLPVFFAIEIAPEYAWYVENVARLPEGLCVTFRYLYQPLDGRSACMTLRYAPGRIELRAETCTLGPITTNAMAALEKRIQKAMRIVKGSTHVRSPSVRQVQAG